MNTSRFPFQWLRIVKVYLVPEIPPPSPSETSISGAEEYIYSFQPSPLPGIVCTCYCCLLRLLPRGKKILHLGIWVFLHNDPVWYFCGIFNVCCTGKLKLSHKNHLGLVMKPPCGFTVHIMYSDLLVTKNGLFSFSDYSVDECVIWDNERLRI